MWKYFFPDGGHNLFLLLKLDFRQYQECIKIHKRLRAIENYFKVTYDLIEGQNTCTYLWWKNIKNITIFSGDLWPDRGPSTTSWTHSARSRSLLPSNIQVLLTLLRIMLLLVMLSRIMLILLVMLLRMILMFLVMLLRIMLILLVMLLRIILMLLVIRNMSVFTTFETRSKEHSLAFFGFETGFEIIV